MTKTSIERVVIQSLLSKLVTNFFSYCSKKFKINFVLTLLDRAYAICSSYRLLHKESEFLFKKFIENCFQKSLVVSLISRFVDMFTSTPLTLLAKKKISTVSYLILVTSQSKLKLNFRS